MDTDTKYELIEDRVIAVAFHGHKNEKYSQHLSSILTLDLNLNDEFNLGLGYSLFIKTESEIEIASIEVGFMYEVDPNPRVANSFLAVLLDSFERFTVHYNTTIGKHFEKFVVNPPNYQELLSEIRSGLLSMSN